MEKRRRTEREEEELKEVVTDEERFNGCTAQKSMRLAATADPEKRKRNGENNSS